MLNLIILIFICNIFLGLFFYFENAYQWLHYSYLIFLLPNYHRIQLSLIFDIKENQIAFHLLKFYFETVFLYFLFSKIIIFYFLCLDINVLNINSIYQIYCLFPYSIILEFSYYYLLSSILFKSFKCPTNFIIFWGFLNHSSF